MSDSTWNDPRITAYVLDELSEDDRQEFETELAGNTELAAAVAEARSVTGRLEGLFAAEPTPALDEDRRTSIIGDGTSTPHATVAPATNGSWRAPLIALAIAASLLLLVGGPMLVRRNGGTMVGQADGESAAVATDEELSSYGKEAAKGQALETMARVRSNADLSIESQPEDELSFVEDQVEESEGFAVAGGSESRRATLSDVVDQSAMRGRQQGQQAVDRSLNKRSESALAESKADQNAAGRGGARIRNQPLGVPASAQPAAAQPAAADSSASSGLGALGGKATNEFKSRIKSRLEQNAAIPSNAPGGVDAPLQAGAASKDIGERARFGLEDVDLARAPRQLNRIRSTRAVEPPGRFDEFGDADAEGIGPGRPGDKFEPITDNPFKRVSEHPISTFSVDVDTASYSKTRDFLARANQLPRPDAVRIEELINYFDYDYEAPSADDQHPFTTHTVVTSCPWNSEHRLARIALKGKVIENSERPRCNLVFLLDTSGSMNAPNKLPLVVEGMRMLLNQLDKKDRVAITVYAGSAGLVLESTAARKKGRIRKALTQLSAGGSTNGGAGIALAYQTARDNFIADGVNRVILCTDGDFNVGATGTDALVRMVQKEAKGGIFLSVLGFGMGNHNDSMLEQISGQGNGNYAFIDNQKEAHKVLVDQTESTLVTIAKDVKLQIEFNPNKVSSYRLIGYENRILAKEDFNDDKKDAGEIGAGHEVTALYEIVPVGVEADESRPQVDDLKYQSDPQPTDAADSDEMMTLKLRYKAPDGDTSTLVEFPVTDDGGTFDDAEKDFRFTAAVAGFGMQLRRSEYRGSWTLRDVRQVAEQSKGEDEHGLRTEFIELVDKASQLMGQE